jgi:hypothetical protein
MVANLELLEPMVLVIMRPRPSRQFDETVKIMFQVT